MRRDLLWGLAAAAALCPGVRAQNTFVGVATCARCHVSSEPGGALHSWRSSRHAQAFETLRASSEGAPRTCGDVDLWIVALGRGEKYGLPRPAAESKECLACHTTAFGADPKRLDASFDASQGVQCEACHGPGSAHVAARSAATPPASGDGLAAYADEQAIRARCQRCHDGTCGDFDFETMWPKIRHSGAKSQ